MKLEEEIITALKKDENLYTVEIIYKYSKEKSYSLNISFEDRGNREIIIDEKQFEYSSLEKLFHGLFSYLHDNEYISYNATDELKDMNLKCHLGVPLFNICINNKEQKLKIFFELNDYKSIINGLSDEIDQIKMFEKYIIEMFDEELLDVNVNFKDIGLLYHMQNFKYKEIYDSLTYKMIQDISNNKDVLENEVYNELIYGLDTFEVKYYKAPKEIKSMIRKANTRIFKYESYAKNKICNERFDLEQFNDKKIYYDKVCDNMYDILKSRFTPSTNKFTVLYDKNKCILIIYFYYIAEKNIKKIKKEIEEIKMFYKN